MNADQCAILMPTRNRPGILRRTLEELLQRGFGDHPLLVYDDASEDAKAVAEVVALWPGARVIRSDIRTGQAKGRNVLMRAAPSEYALFLDDDSWPEDRAKIADAFGSARKDGLAIATFPYRSLADGKLSVPPHVLRGRTSSFLGGASLFHLPSLLAVGAYRELFIYGYEEPELALRLWLAGGRIEYFPEAVITHNQFYTPDERRDYREYDFLYARNGILMSSLNMPLWFGLPHGLARSFRRSLYHRRNLWPKVKGTFAGIRLTVFGGKERRPGTFRHALDWCRFNRECSR